MEGHKLDDKVIKKTAQLQGLALTELPSLSVWDSVTKVILANNALSSCEALAKLPNIRKLDLSHNVLVSIDALPPKLQKLNVEHNPSLLQILSLPSSLSELNLAETPALAYPSRSLTMVTARKPICKGRKLTTVRKWLEEHAAVPAPTFRLHGESGGSIDFSIGLCADSNEKPMEDRHLSHLALDSASRHPQSSHVRVSTGALFGVFDGHMGVYAAEFAQKHLPVLVERAGLLEGGLASSSEAAGVLGRLVEEMDATLCDELVATKRNDGAALAVALVSNEGVVSAAWLGDSRVIVAHADGSFTALTSDHKPDCDSERARIESLGGTVVEKGVPRVNGVIAMSRSIGDVRFKRPIPYLSSVAGTTSYKLRPGLDSHIILASDGLWDVCSSTLASRTANSVGAASDAARKLVRVAKLNGTHDNILVLCIRVEGPLKQK